MALLFIPLTIAIGCSIDYVRAWNTKLKMQNDLDAALIAAVREVDSLTEEKLQAKVSEWFLAQADAATATYDMSEPDIIVNKTDRTIEAVAVGTLETTFLKIANIDTVDVAVKSAVAGPATAYLEVHIAIDKSASMLLAATSDGQSALRSSVAKCEFACHTTEGTFKYNGITYTNVYDLSVALGVELRADVSVSAVQELISLIETANSNASHIKIALYTVGSTATQVLAPTYSTSTAAKYLTDKSYKLTGATSEPESYFDVSLPELAKVVGNAGDGSSATAPKKLFLLITDGVQSSRPYVNEAYSNVAKKCIQYSGTTCVKYNSARFKYQGRVTPLNPDWCDTFKDNDVTVGVLYTEYLAIPLDWGYNMTVGETMASSEFTSYWGGTMRTSVSDTITRRDYIPYALKDCATSDAMFLSANDPDEIEAGLSSLFTQYISAVRLTE